MAKHWCPKYDPKPNANGCCGDCFNYCMVNCKCRVESETTALVHERTPIYRKGSRVSGVLK